MFRNHCLRPLTFSFPALLVMVLVMVEHMALQYLGGK